MASSLWMIRLVIPNDLKRHFYRNEIEFPSTSCQWQEQKIRIFNKTYHSLVFFQHAHMTCPCGEEAKEKYSQILSHFEEVYAILDLVGMSVFLELRS